MQTACSVVGTAGSSGRLGLGGRGLGRLVRDAERLLDLRLDVGEGHVARRDLRDVVREVLVGRVLWWVPRVQ